MNILVNCERWRLLRGRIPPHYLKSPLEKIQWALKIRGRQLAIFPGGGPPSIFASMSLYDRVRDGNGCFPHDWSPTNSSIRTMYTESCIGKISLIINFFLYNYLYRIAPVVLRTASLRSYVAILCFANLL